MEFLLQKQLFVYVGLVWNSVWLCIKCEMRNALKNHSFLRDTSSANKDINTINLWWLGYRKDWKTLGNSEYLFLEEERLYFLYSPNPPSKSGAVPLKAQNWVEFEEVCREQKERDLGNMQHQCLRLSENNWVTSTLRNVPQVLLQYLLIFFKRLLQRIKLLCPCFWIFI